MPAFPRPARPDGFSVLGLLAVLATLLLVGLPLAWVLSYALGDESGAPSLGNLRQVGTDPTLLGPLLTTFAVAGSVAVAALVVAVPLAWLVSRTNMPFGRMVRFLVLTSCVAPPFLGAVAWELLAAPNTGLINVAWRVLLDQPPFEYLVNIYSLPGLVFVDTCYAFGFAFTLVATALDRVPDELEEASSIFGASRLGTLRQVTLPLVLPALAVSFIVAFLRSMVEFGTPGVLALPAGFNTMTTRIWSLFQYPPKAHLAAAAALPLLAASVVLLWGQRLLVGARGFTLVGGKGTRVAPLPLGRLRWLALAGCLLVLAVPVFLPLAALADVAFTAEGGGPDGFGGLSLANVRFVLTELSTTWPAFAHTLELGLGTACIGVALAFVVAVVVTRRHLPGAALVGAAATAPAAVPSIVLAVGMFVAYTRPPLMLYGTLGILLLTFVTLEIPAAFQQVGAGLRVLHPELEDAARIFGASRGRAVLDVMLPLLRPVLVSAWCFAFIGAVRELSAAILLFTANTETVPVLIYDLNESGRIGPIAVLGLMLLAMSAVVVGVVSRLAHPRSRP